MLWLATLSTTRLSGKSMQIRCDFIYPETYESEANLEQVILKHRTLLASYNPYRPGDVRYLSPGQVIFVLTMHDIESMRSAAGCPSSLVSWFINDSLNKQQTLNSCMEAVAEKVTV